MWLVVVAHRVATVSNRAGSRSKVHEGCLYLFVAMSHIIIRIIIKTCT